ncbi:MAG: ABC transporter ATP-binding protein [Clostridia bacterium]|jgi:ABC-2 type transport system ATP-binding protein|nr:ABC transporter ATP-binding protein [Clostridia bacterium]
MIQTKRITKIFGSQRAVDDLDLSIESGVSYGLLGPNGAGKTTLLKMLATLIMPTSGEVHINGERMTRTNKAVKKQLGMVSQHFSLQREMTPREVLKLHGMLHRMPRKLRKHRAEELLEFADLLGDADKLVGKLSGGNKRKLMIIRAVMHSPKLLFLDEPTVGLDAAIRRSIWDLLKKLKGRGMTMILTTHYIDEASILCDRIGMMSEGKIVTENTPDGFLETVLPYVVEHFDNEQTNYEYFDDRKKASEYAVDLDESALIRRTNLEDVYVKLTSRRVMPGKRS